MSYQRTIFAFALLATVALAVTVSAKPENLIVNPGENGHNVVHSEFIYKPSKLFQVVEADRSFITDGGEKITGIRLFDRNEEGNGATASITAGGLGFSFVNVHFKSKRGHSIDFVAVLIGKN